MVRGIDIFKNYFDGYTGQYVFIGGTACDIILGKQGIDFRATKDFDIVLLIEALDEKFVQTFMNFIEVGGYEHIKKGTSKNQFYRFEKPQDRNFPYMIEIFSRKPDFLIQMDTRLAPIHVSDDAVSLSAILLDDEYYDLLKKGAIEIDGVSVLRLEYLILFKMKAWTDLTARKNDGEKIDGKNIKKHRNDIFRLAVNIDSDIHIPISENVDMTIKQFIGDVRQNSIDLKNIGIRNTSVEDILHVIENCYILDDEGEKYEYKNK